MKKYLLKFVDSSKELGHVQSLAVCAMMLAINVLLSTFSKFALPIMPYVKIGFMFIPIILTAYLYGPVCAAIVSAGGDVLGALFNNTTPFAFNPAITACCIFEGILYGVVLYKSDFRLRDLIISKVAVLVLCHLPLNTLALYTVFGLSYGTLLLYRMAVLIPFAVIEVVVMMLLKKPLLRIINGGK